MLLSFLLVRGGFLLASFPYIHLVRNVIRTHPRLPKSDASPRLAFDVVLSAMKREGSGEGEDTIRDCLLGEKQAKRTAEPALGQAVLFPSSGQSVILLLWIHPGLPRCSYLLEPFTCMRSTAVCFSMQWCSPPDIPSLCTGARAK